jgi:hypothetical protein
VTGEATETLVTIGDDDRICSRHSGRSRLASMRGRCSRVHLRHIQVRTPFVTPIDQEIGGIRFGGS